MTLPLSSRWLPIAALLLCPAMVAAQDASTLRPNLPTAGVIKVCADPDNLPFSNEKQEGFENKLADLLGSYWNSRVEYAWWPVRRGYFARGLNGRYCDMAMTAPDKIDMVATTRAYFRTGYAVVYRKDSGLHITSLDDTTLKHLRIGVNLLNSDAENTPPAMAMSYHGVVGNLVGFPTFYSDLERPEDIINAVTDKKIDVALVWGPLAGYFIKQTNAPLVMNMLEDDSVSGLPMNFSIAIATRRQERALRDSLQAFLVAKRPEIQALLQEYGFPLEPLPADTTGTSRPPSR
ncbi:MAG TPA: quinoprotein dehydrogenase-associated putative ABC transporter substrate-binding protein [Gemmatimonadales bacterium]|nr:quinoprotein dehydrogenase-associated putative ABC transporter substrate-binding protein [Gemmatimonadales bacterium]